MRDADDLSFSEMRNKRGQNAPARPPEEPAFTAREFSSARTLSPPPATREADEPEDEGGFKLPVDRWRIVAAIKRRWAWVLLAACVAGLIGFVGGYFKVPYKINVTLIMREASPAFTSGMVGESYRPEQLTMQTLANLITSPELTHRVADKAQPPLSETALKKAVSAKQALQTDLVKLTIAGKAPQSLRELATNYVNEAVQMGKELQISETVKMNKFYKERIAALEIELRETNQALIAFQKESKLVDPEIETKNYMDRLGELLSRYDKARIDAEVADVQITALKSELARQNPVAQKLAVAKNKLAELLIQYTEEHPEVQRQGKAITELQRQQPATATDTLSAGDFADNSLASTLYKRLIELEINKDAGQKELEKLTQRRQELLETVTGISETGMQYAKLKATLDSLKNTYSTLVKRQGEAQLYEDNAQGYYRLFGMETITRKSRLVGIAKFALLGFVLGALASGLVVAGFEILDDSLKTAVDIQNVTGLPLLATLGDLNTMSPAEKDTWAFRTWTALSGQLSASANHGMVCGFISSMHGEGRSTWINLLVNAASHRGFRVLTVATRPPRCDPATGETSASESEKQFGEAITEALAATKTDLPEQIAMLTPQALAFPAEVTRQFTGPNALPIAHIPLPGWVWNLERRKQWQSALAHWRAIDNLVLLVELPPASLPESVLLAENLPQLIWLVDSGKPRMRATREQLETLRHAKCRLVGAVLNHEPKPIFQL